MKFKIGDKVICIETGGYLSLTIGKEYTVVDLINDDNRDIDKDKIIFIIDDENEHFGYKCKRFKHSIKTIRKEKLKKIITSTDGN